MDHFKNSYLLNGFSFILMLAKRKKNKGPISLPGSVEDVDPME